MSVDRIQVTYRPQAQHEPRPKLAATPLACTGLLLCTGLLFRLSLAPTLLWGDDAMFQRALATGILTNHPVWGILARVFARLPVGDPAFRANLISAFCATAAVGFIFLGTIAAGGSLRAALLAGLSLAISHTFWLEAVRAEVYALHMALFLCGLWALLEWRRAVHRKAWLALAVAAWLLATINHLLMILALPGGLWLAWKTYSSAARRRSILPLLVVGAVATVAIVRLSPTFVAEVLRSARFIRSTFRLSPRWMLLHMAVALYQFPLLGILAVPGFLHMWRNDRDLALSLSAMALPTAVFAATHGILESYVFYLPLYGLLAMCIGLGYDHFCRNWPWHRWLALAATVAALQFSLYRATPVVLQHFAPRLIYARDLPGRPANEFFLWPPKRGYMGARWFAETTMELLPANGVVMADWTPFAPLQYLQEVEGRRHDVLLVAADPSGVQVLRRESGLRSTFLADADPRYYPTTEIAKWFQVRPAGIIFELVPLGPST